MDKASAFFELQNLLSYQNVLVVIAAWFILETLKKLFRGFFQNEVGQRLIVLLPMVICQALVWSTMAWQPAASAGERIVLGFVLAFLTAHAHDVLKRFGLHEYVPGLRKLKKP